MIRINISGQSYKVKTKADELSVIEGAALAQIAEEYDNTSHEFRLKAVELLSNAPANVLAQVFAGHLNELCNQLPILNGSNTGVFVKCLKIKGQYFALKDFDKLTTKEYAHIEQMMRDQWKNYAQVLAVLWQPITVAKFAPQSGHFTPFEYARNTYHQRKKIKGILPVFDEDFLEDRAVMLSKEMTHELGVLTLASYTDWVTENAELYPCIFGKRPTGEEEETSTDPLSGWGVLHYAKELSDGSKRDFDNWMQSPVVDLFAHVDYTNEMYKKHKPE